MKRILFALAVLSGAGPALVPQQALGQAYGPGDKGATLKQPWLDSAPSPPRTSGQTPSYLQGLLETSGAARALPGTRNLATSLQSYDSMGMNNDILVTPEVGPWVILVTSYGGPEGPVRARQMVSVLRSQFKLPAYVFNFGAEEKRKELARVARIIEDQKAKLKANNLNTDQPIRVRHEKIEEYCGVLVGGYPSDKAAAEARNKLRELKLDDDQWKVFTLKTPGDLLDVKYYVGDTDPKTKGKTGAAYVNPFMRAMPVPNPTVKVQRPTEKLDVAALKYMNSAEEFSLFKCRRTFTLVIKQFNLPASGVTRKDSGAGGLLDSIGLGKKSSGHDDYAGENAHKLAEALRKTKLEAYVLHMKYYSLVTVGGFDSMDDQNLRSMQNLLETRLLPKLESLQVFPKAMPMRIPH